jgi:uncharacterized membrane protein YhaH (DUF805 family)
VIGKSIMLKFLGVNGSKATTCWQTDARSLYGESKMEKYFNFREVATRSEYWAVIIIATVLAAAAGFIGGLFLAAGSNAALAFGVVILLAAVVLGTWVTIATCVRRCRDAGINVWWTLAACAPYIGWIVAIVIGVLPTKVSEQ